MNPHQKKPLARKRQAGVAAVEFALIAVVMLSLFAGLSIYWDVLQTQQVLSRATGDGARQAHRLLTSGGMNTSEIESVVGRTVCDSLDSYLPLQSCAQDVKVSLTEEAGRPRERKLTVEYQRPPMLGRKNPDETHPSNPKPLSQEPDTLQAVSIITLPLRQ
ncbi:TadE/TadG family type IV pilus assembly protein [Comamonas composti]|uniref:TadE/TadG family type IV pilus assembly protein n=1 Tax=Comamonas composti TaxID=408558 RepID=UPI000417B781|nr:TadE/TadG family type IV pilus assembly protein [Comamonas composti]